MPDNLHLARKQVQYYRYASAGFLEILHFPQETRELGNPILDISTRMLTRSFQGTRVYDFHIISIEQQIRLWLMPNTHSSIFGSMSI
ncbi:hypothetical protein D3C85_1267730 [compost metagenome]